MKLFRIFRRRFIVTLAALLPLLADAADSTPDPSAESVVFIGKDAPAAQDAATKAARAWARVPEILSRIVAPTFPSRDFTVTNFAAVGDGETDCTKAFRDAIETCQRAGGGRVVVPPGIFLSGPIHLKSRVNLHLAKGATIRFTTNTAAYMPLVFTRFECVEVMN